jgi:monofunctional chorismate mutase
LTEVQIRRNEIDKLDRKIVRLLGERAKICKAIGAAKKARGLPVKDLKREAEVFSRIREIAVELDLNQAQVEAVYREIVNMCSTVQE